MIGKWCWIMLNGEGIWCDDVVLKWWLYIYIHINLLFKLVFGMLCKYWLYGIMEENCGVGLLILDAKHFIVDKWFVKAGSCVELVSESTTRYVKHTLTMFFGMKTPMFHQVRFRGCPKTCIVLRYQRSCFHSIKCQNVSLIYRKAPISLLWYWWFRNTLLMYQWVFITSLLYRKSITWFLLMYHYSNGTILAWTLM